MSLLSCRGLTRRPWFENRSVDVEQGEIVVVEGPTGSGKTLFLRALADLDPVDSGEMELRGRACAALSPREWRSRVLYLHQSPVRLTGKVRENLERIHELAVHAGKPLPSVPGVSADSPMERVSGGEAQLVALTRAMALAPDVLLLDEATSALDGGAARQAEREIRSWVGSERAALWVAHDPNLASRLDARRLKLS